MKHLIKELTPPIVLRLARKLHPSRANINAQVHAKEQGADYYDRRFLRQEHQRQHYTYSKYYPLWTIIVDRISRSGATSILEVGCGSGQFALFLRDKGLPNYLGIDFSPERVKHASSVCGDFDFVLADVFETDIIDTHDYDTVICLEFLEHVERDLEVLGRIRSGTRFYGTVPNFPFRSHVRHFANAHDVFEHYKQVFRELSVDTHLANEKVKKFFIMEGVIS